MGLNELSAVTIFKVENF